MPDRTVTSAPLAAPIGYIDVWHDGATAPAGRVTVRGWALDVPPPRAILVAVDGVIVALARHGLPRPDVAAAHPDLPGADTSGWSAEIDLPSGSPGAATVSATIIRADGQVALLGDVPLG